MKINPLLHNDRLMKNKNLLNFDLPVAERKIIKVIGVGGGGGNAVSHMYREGMQEVAYAICNTDSQALSSSEVPVKLMIGDGTGVGDIPERAEDAAVKSDDAVRQMVNDGSLMVFITAGMGGGTGTGAAPVVARIAKDSGLLTIGIVTIPFQFEGPPKINQALQGIIQMKKNVDALLVINNERLCEIYPDLSLLNAFAKADDTVAVAAKSIAELITLPGVINLDFRDVETTMKEGGVALISYGYGKGEGRMEQSIKSAIHSPLLNNSDLFKAKKILFNISFSEKAELKVSELDFIRKFMGRFSDHIRVIWGTAVDESLGDNIKFTLLASGFDTDNSGADNEADEIAHLYQKYYGNLKQGDEPEDDPETDSKQGSKFWQLVKDLFKED